MNEAPAFFSERDALQWSGEPSAVEEWAWSDGAIAVAIGCAVLASAILASAAIAITMTIGRVTR